MSTITDNGFARISNETIIRNPNTPGALTGDNIAFSPTLTINEKISTITGVDLTASSVENIPSGNLSSINVQDALNELQADIDGKVVQTITNGVTTTAPSQDAVFDALALKAPLASPTFTGTPSTPFLKITNVSADVNDGKIGADLFAEGLNIVGVNTDTTARKLALWGGITQMENSLGNTFTGVTNFTGTVGGITAAMVGAPSGSGTSSGTNTGDQTSIVGITGTLAQFNTACTDANFARTDAGNTFAGTQTLGGTGKLLVVGDDASFHDVNISGCIALKGESDATAGRLQLGTSAYIQGNSSGTLTLNGAVTARINPRLIQATNYTTSVTMDFDTNDEYDITAQAGALLFNNPSGTPVNGQKRIVRIKDNGTARALTYGSQFASGAAVLPTTTTISKKMWIGFEWDSTDSKWYCIATGVQP